MSPFSKGDMVRWTSSSQGYTKEKLSVIVHVVAAGEGVPSYFKRGAKAHPGLPRDHESYIVKVKGKGHYWPRVSLLQKAEGWLL
jgi:hypothetical protein